MSRLTFGAMVFVLAVVIGLLAACRAGGKPQPRGVCSGA